MERFENLQTDMLEKVITWSGFNSGTFNVAGLARLRARLETDFEILKADEKTVFDLPALKTIGSLGQAGTHPLGQGLRLKKRCDLPRTILLCGHMDTVFSSDDPFQKPIQKTAETLQGPGVVDMKGGLCILLYALAAFEKTAAASRLGWEIILTPDEEIGSPGSRTLLEQVAKQHQFGFVFEPALDQQGTFAGLRQGSQKYYLTVRGKSAHVGRDFYAGHHAIAALAKLVVAIHALNDPQKKGVINVGKISGGRAVNVVPDFAFCQLDLRFHDLKQAESLNSALLNLVEQANQNPNFEVVLECTNERPPKTMPATTQKLYDLVEQVAHDLKQPFVVKATGGCCDGNTLSHAGLPTIDTLGAIGTGIHTAFETLQINSLGQRAALFLGVLNRLAGQYE